MYFLNHYQKKKNEMRICSNTTEHRNFQKSSKAWGQSAHHTLPQSLGQHCVHDHTAAITHFIQYRRLHQGLSVCLASRSKLWEHKNKLYDTMSLLRSDKTDTNNHSRVSNIISTEGHCAPSTDHSF